MQNEDTNWAAMPDGALTPGGSRIIHGTPRTDTFRGPVTAAENLDHIAAHLAPLYGDYESVLHEIISDIVHLDVLVFPPRRAGDVWTYVTSGMSDLPMTLPDDLAARNARAEMMIHLPDAWGRQIAALAPGAPDADAVFWPISLMKFLARMPHENGTWLGDGHTVPFGEPVAPDTRMDGVIVHGAFLPDDKFQMTLPGGDVVNFLSYTPLYPEEMEFKLREGSDALYDRFDRMGMTPGPDVHRRSVVRRNPLLRLIGRG